MPTPITNLSDIRRSMHPVLNPGVFVYALLPEGGDVSGLNPVVTVREKEGLTVVLEESLAQNAGLEIIFRSAWITLNVHSDLQALGLTAAFSGELTKAKISCNVVAGVFHDHIFVPVEHAQAAMAVLQLMQANA